MNIAGFDVCSKNIACVILDSDKEWKNSIFIESTAKTWELRLNELVLKLENTSFIPKIDVAFIETPIYLQNIKATNSIARVVGIVHSKLIRKGISAFEVDNKSWKKDIIGNGNAQKEDIKRFVDAIYPGKANNQDLCDAACIALWGVNRSGK